jgi:hypothetical protein
MSQDDTLGKIPSQRIIAGRIAQQTSECAYFISNYWEDSFCKSSSYCTPHMMNLILLS